MSGPSTDGRWRRRGMALAAHVVVLHSLMAYGLSGSEILGGLLLFALAAWFGGAHRALVGSASLLAGTLLLAGLIEALDLDRSLQTRPHDVLRMHDPGTGLSHYKRDAIVHMDGVAGDLAHMTREPIASPRSITFRTDGLGYRNDRPFRDQTYLLVGDSFVVGIGNTQADILTEQLAARGAPDFYNLGFPGDPIDYEAMVDTFPSQAPSILLFLFEGNDFPEELGTPEDKRRTVLYRYLHMFQDTGMYRLLKTWRKRLSSEDDAGGPEPVVIESTRAGPIAFYRRYVYVSERTVAPSPPELEAFLRRKAQRIHTVFFIPTKYRVYQPMIRPEASLPNTQWEHLSTVCERLGLRCVDLTPELVRRSLALWAEGRLTYWPDDSHWNAEGMAVATEAVLDAVRRTRPGETGGPAR